MWGTSVDHNVIEYILLVNAHVSIKGPDSPSLQFKELLESEKSNFRLVNTAVSYLGGVPAMINPADMSNTIPSEKVRHKGFSTNLSPPRRRGFLRFTGK